MLFPHLADTKKQTTILGWKSELSLKEALASAWKWEKKIRLNEIFIYCLVI